MAQQRRQLLPPAASWLLVALCSGAKPMKAGLEENLAMKHMGATITVRLPPSAC